MMLRSLGDMEVVTATSAHLKQTRHVTLLEDRVDKLVEENRLLKIQIDSITSNSSTVSYKRFEAICKKYQELLSETVPF